MESVEFEILSYIKLDPNKDQEIFDEFGMEAVSQGLWTTFVYRKSRSSQDVVLTDTLDPETQWADDTFPLDYGRLLDAAKVYMERPDCQ